MATIKGSGIEFEQVGRNLWKYDRDGEGKVSYFRLFGKGITPNRCWLAGAYMRELVDIDIPTGKDIFSNWIQDLELGTVTIYNEYLKAV